MIRARLHDGRIVSGRLTTDHASSSYGVPVFVDADNRSYGSADLDAILARGDADATRQAAEFGGYRVEDPLAPEAIKAGREGLGLTQQEFATAVGCSLAAVSQWERGVKRPTGLYARSVEALITGAAPAEPKLNRLAQAGRHEKTPGRA